MSFKFSTPINPIKFTAILSLVLVFGLSAAWAIETYYAYKVIKKGGTSDRLITIAESEEGSVNFRIPAGALDDYLDEQDKDKVKITFIDCKD